MPAKKKTAPKKKPASKKMPASKKKPAPKKKKKAPKKSGAKGAAAVTKLETFPEGEEGIDLVCVAKAAKRAVPAGLAISPTGRFVLAGEEDGRCRVIDIERGEARELSRATEAVRSFGFLDNETAVVGDQAGQLRIVDLRSGAERVAVPASKSSLTALAVSDGLAAFCRPRHAMYTWRESAGAEMLDGLRGHATVIVVDEGKVYAAASTPEEAGTVAVHVWDAKSGAELRTLTAPVEGRVTRMIVVGGRVVAAVEASGATAPVVVSWDEAGNNTVRVTLDDDSMVDFVSPLDDKRVVVGHFEQLTYVDVVSGAKSSASLSPWHATSAAQGNIVLVAGEEGNIGIYDAAAGTLLLEREAEAVLETALAPDRVTLAISTLGGDVFVYRAHPPR